MIEPPESPVAEMELAVLLFREPRLMVPEGTAMMIEPPEKLPVVALADSEAPFGRVKDEEAAMRMRPPLSPETLTVLVVTEEALEAMVAEAPGTPAEAEPDEEFNVTEPEAKRPKEEAAPAVTVEEMEDRLRLPVRATIGTSSR